jgi:hypothetical protein
MMGQEGFFLVWRFCVTMAAGSAALSNRQGDTAAADFVVCCLVAIMALKTQAPHVDIAAAAVKIKKGVEFAVPDKILVTTREMTVAAGFSAGLAYFFCNLDQIH